jgi:AcrR family transcriptional regulator
MARTGRPLAMTADERKAAIYAAAERLFGERGYEKVTMADIAAEAGMSKRTLYLMFTDKEALLKGLIASSYIWPEGAFQGEDEDRVAELRLRLRVIANHVLSERHINLCRLAIGESVGIEGLAGAFLEMGIGRSRESLIQSIARIDKSRLNLDLPPHVLAGMLYGATCAFNLMNALLTGAEPDLAKVYETIDTVIDRTFKP